MIPQILRVLLLARPSHVWKAVVSPRRTLRATQYHYRRVSEREFIEFFVSQFELSKEVVDALYENWHKHENFRDAITDQLSIYPENYGLEMTHELPALYLLVRLIKPRVVVETGVASGASSAHTLRALEDNGEGELYSIDVPPEDLPVGKTSGWIVPDSLRNRWLLHIGDSKELLHPLLNELGQVDCFLHDSLHPYEHMLWEFKTVGPHLRPGGLFLAHDVGRHEAFRDFMSELRIPSSGYRVFHVLGGFRKPLSEISR